MKKIEITFKDNHTQVRVHHGVGNRKRVTTFDSRHEADYINERGGMPREPTLNAHEWRRIMETVNLIGNANEREDAPLKPFDDLCSGTEKLSVTNPLVLAHPKIHEVSRILVVKELSPRNCEINSAEGTIKVLPLNAMAGGSYVEVEYAWERPLQSRFMG